MSINEDSDNTPSQSPDAPTYVSRSGLKLAAALDAFDVDPCDKLCADLGSNVGGFVDCLLRRGARCVYAVDTGYGVLAYKLRIDPRVKVLERTNAMHVVLPESADLVTIDTGWTRQVNILPNALKMLKSDGHIITLIKPHYEANSNQVRGGILDPTVARHMLPDILDRIRSVGLTVDQRIESPITGRKGNIEFLVLLSPQTKE